MYKLKNNLKGSKGASMIIAMVFMLFCVFVGGSVLTAATVNSNRVRDMNIRQQQQKMNEESAALYIADSIRNGKQNLKVVITDKTVKTQPVIVYKDGSVADNGAKSDPVRTVSIKIESTNGESEPEELNIIQKIMLECGIRKHMIGYEAPIQIKGFKWNNTLPEGSHYIRNTGEFWVPKQTGTPFEYSFNVGSDLFPDKDYKVIFNCNSDNDLLVTFEFPTQDGSTAKSTVAVKMSASQSIKKLTPETELIVRSKDPATGNQQGEKKFITQTTTVYSWTDPKIVKVGA